MGEFGVKEFVEAFKAGSGYICGKPGAFLSGATECHRVIGHKGVCAAVPWDCVKCGAPGVEGSPNSETRAPICDVHRVR